MKYDAGDYDVAVIGAGHAGCEAALATARMGLKTLMFSIKFLHLLLFHFLHQYLRFLLVLLINSLASLMYVSFLKI